MSEREAIDSFIDKWRARWPEWSVAEVFVPHAQRETAAAWMALVQELTDAAWGGSDPRPGEAKLGWWAEELQGWTRGIRRHPLGIVLQKFPVDWLLLARALPALRDSRERPVDSDEAHTQLRPFAEAAASIEAGLFGGAADAQALVAANLLQLRLAHHPGEAVPLQVLAQVGEGAALAAWSQQLAGRISVRGGTAPRRVLAGIAKSRLRRGDAVQPVGAMRALWAAWGAARG
ncbi:phytoene/squalene synthase family protein [Lysobacter solisilvae (ex Woo and Kim 2020)]|uniref:Phytoene/squalene synthase family protein n=1 Tax=Agrilutibacter terrestris TaxID=2865112 RepID=A0A7H0FWN1_9GAMM|nr:phytoene/squalene synthase family protein [Lysobacter terrestris]QNP40447.1 phytoene/squalene synthase family protein [Lysobacter terrestris]